MTRAESSTLNVYDERCDMRVERENAEEMSTDKLNKLIWYFVVSFGARYDLESGHKDHKDHADPTYN